MSTGRISKGKQKEGGGGKPGLMQTTMTKKGNEQMCAGSKYHAIHM